MKEKKYMLPLFLVLIIVLSWSYTMYLYNSLTLDSKIKILTTNWEETIETYDDLIKDKSTMGKPTLILFNNGWTKDKLLELNHFGIYENCRQEGWNLIYLSNEFGDQKYNRDRINWLNDICNYKLYGYHIYASEPFEMFDNYILKKKTLTGETYSFPHALITNQEGIITDTLYNYQNALLRSLIK